MNIRYLSTALVLALLVAAPALALEKSAAPFNDSERPWAAGSTATITYFNICTGWIWIWSGWSPGDRVGVSAELPASFCSVVQTWHYFTTGAPGGYGFTGTLSLEPVDANDCPSGAPFASQAFLPVSGWNSAIWSVFPSGDFAVVNAFGDGVGNPAGLATDHPAAGPTGPAACGFCYPSTRVNHTFYWGRAASPLCPGSAFNDGVCNAEFVWDIEAVCADYILPESWAAVKQLYR